MRFIGNQMRGDLAEIAIFGSVTNGWIDYSHNHVLVKLFSHTLISSESGHVQALEKIKEDIVKLKKISGVKLK